MRNDLSDYLFNITDNQQNIFSVLTDKERSVLDSNCLTRHIRKGGLIFQEGNNPEGLIYLTKGSVKVYKIGVGEREQIVRLVKPMTFVGYKALFAEKTHTTNAEAIEDSEIVIYDRKVLFQVIENNASFSKEIIKALANELAFNFNRIINLTQKHIRGRLSETLLLIKDIYGFEDDGKTLQACFTRENIAHFSNMTTSNAIRTLKKFSDERLIKTEGKKIVLLNIPELEKISKIG
jgi:CRP/FNR family transcriptional regulator, polysaccharide utilization system transcription regulator